jgi:hypothetical protein
MRLRVTSQAGESNLVGVRRALGDPIDPKTGLPLERLSEPLGGCVG